MNENTHEAIRFSLLIICIAGSLITLMSLVYSFNLERLKVEQCDKCKAMIEAKQK